MIPMTLCRSTLLSILFLFSSCYKNHLYVQQEKVDVRFLASSRVGTPDPRQKNPPEGQRLLIAWDFPLSVFREELILVTTVRLWDQSEEVKTYPLKRKRDSLAYFFPSKTEDKKILTYRVQVFNREGHLVEEWKHQFWRELINFEERAASADKSNEEVSSRLRHASVMETP